MLVNQTPATLSQAFVVQDNLSARYDMTLRTYDDAKAAADFGTIRRLDEVLAVRGLTGAAAEARFQEMRTA